MLKRKISLVDKQNLCYLVINSSVLKELKSQVNIKKYIAELKRRHVFKAGLAYLIAAWVFTEVAALVLDAFSAPPYFLKTILIIIAIGFPIWLVFSWVYDLTPEGITKTSNTNQPVSKSPKIISFPDTVSSASL